MQTNTDPDNEQDHRLDLVSAVRRRATRRTPIGGPWWAYALGIGIANLVRQLLLPDDVDTWLNVTTFVATVVVVSAAVAGVSRLLARRHT